MFRVQSGARTHKICGHEHYSELLFRCLDQILVEYGLFQRQAIIFSSFKMGGGIYFMLCKTTHKLHPTPRIIVCWSVWGVVISDNVSPRFVILFSWVCVLFVCQLTSPWLKRLVSEIFRVRWIIFRKCGWNEMSGNVYFGCGYLCCRNMSLEFFIMANLLFPLCRFLADCLKLSKRQSVFVVIFFAFYYISVTHRSYLIYQVVI